jgi:hypothetical protein
MVHMTRCDVKRYGGAEPSAAAISTRREVKTLGSTATGRTHLRQGSWSFLSVLVYCSSMVSGLSRPSAAADQQRPQLRLGVGPFVYSRPHSPELRAAVSLSQLWQRQERLKTARQLLAEIYGWFTEGFDTPDLRAVHALLQELENRPPEKP